jgi:hypothetical protein
MSYMTTGKVAFSNLTKHDQFMGKTTGRYSVVITMDAEEAAKLADLGVRIKDYEGTPQRKFSTTFNTDVMDINGDPFVGEIPRGSSIRVAWTTKEPHPEWGRPTYLEAIRVVEEADRLPDDF